MIAPNSFPALLTNFPGATCLTHVGTEGAGSTLTYDPNGNLTGGAGLSGTAIAYDFENRLKKATLTNGTIVENIYDASGRKVRESVTVSGTTKNTDYVLAGAQVIEQYAGTTLSARYVHGRGIDETVRAELDVNGDGTLETTAYPLQDELGNVERLTDTTGATTERYDYQGYGKPRIFDPSGGSRASSAYGWRWLFQGREYQTTLNAYDFRVRELWPDLGRFGQDDPSGTADSQNLYQGLLGAPTLTTDPFGLQSNEGYSAWIIARDEAESKDPDLTWAEVHARSEARHALYQERIAQEAARKSLLRYTFEHLLGQADEFDERAKV